ncbi:MAG: Zn-dependent alcohol dehydrogenase [Burkholderiales bacterium]|nr:Zn-dependent alcohol dehydrogenase [Burkholderiales bacterium]
MKAKAVISREVNKPVVVEEIEVAPPRAGEVMVKLAACGVCHSDLSATNGTIPFPPPVILGHEGAGTVVEVGPGVTDFAVGDHVLSSFVTMCGVCHYCTIGRPALCDVGARTLYTLPTGDLRTADAAGKPLNIFSGVGVMAEYATLNTRSIIRIPQDAPLKQAALVGCGVMTGFCAATNTARVEPGSVVAVFGCGGVGLSAIQGAAVSGAGMIVAVDIDDFKLELARLMGATHTVNSKGDENIVKTLKKLTGGGADYALECVGSGELVGTAYGALRKGGTAVVVGVARPKDMTSFRTASITFEEKTITGSYFGSARPREDAPRILGLYKSGKVKLDELVTRTYRVEEAPQAFADLEAGRNARGVILFDA